ncbi:uncharacterized protein LOC126980781 [Eriocheir sinensis]|uniref:uncharacterized protein LOC126980781 n=1 Tax=Eriocheir sinensis TaxID=95602 RepID=UPI0021C9C180|nr:uncharacterized protein LOC126980781 [Eriocheir sinensis]
MGLLLQLLPVLAVFLFGAPAPGLAVPMAPQHHPSHPGHNAFPMPPFPRDNAIPMPPAQRYPVPVPTRHNAIPMPPSPRDNVPVPTRHNAIPMPPSPRDNVPAPTRHNAIPMPAPPTPSPADVEIAVEFLRAVWKLLLRASEAQRHHPRSTELASPVPVPPSPGAAPSAMSDDDLAAKFIVMVWKFIWRSNQDRFHNAEDGSPPPPPILDMSSLKPLSAHRSPGAAPDSSDDNDSLAEAVKLVWEYMWRGEMQARQRQALQSHTSPFKPPIAPCNPIPVPNSSKPAPLLHPAPLTPAAPQEIFNKDAAAEVTSLLREWSDWKAHARLQAHNTEVLAELRQALQQLLNFPKKAIVAEVLQRIRGKVDANLDKVVVGVDDALRDLSRQLRDTRHRQEPAARSRAKRNFTNARDVDIALVIGLMFMSIVIVIIGNLDPVTQTY